MGTRAIARIYDDDGTEVLAAMYKHWDGYPDGFGKDLEDFASKFTLVNGISLNEERVIANGMGCFAAYLVKEFKQQVGDVYLYPIASKPFDIEYIYHVKPDGEHIKITVEEV